MSSVAADHGNPRTEDAQLVVRELGLRDYAPVWRAMQAYTDQRDAAAADELWVLQHPPIFTQGQAGKPEHVLLPGNIPVLPVDRGGQVTYHGPGQIVAYPLLDLTRRKLGVKQLVCRLEQAVINTLSAFDITARRREGMPGVYVQDAKIASLGLRVRRGKSFHGLAFNVAMDLEPFARINPCGYAGLEVVDIERLQPGVKLLSVQQRLISELLVLLGYTNHIHSYCAPDGLAHE